MLCAPSVVKVGPYGDLNPTWLALSVSTRPARLLIIVRAVGSVKGRVLSESAGRSAVRSAREALGRAERDPARRLIL